jgi:long-subunit fatty acid transport protein
MQKRSTLLSLVGAFALLGTMAYGSGFAILEQSPRGLGTSFAGMAAKIDDPGSLYYNPAVSAWFKESRVALGMNIIRSRATFSNDYSTYADGSPLTGNNGGNAGGYSTVPNCYLIQPISERFAFGLGITATSGTATEWDPGWVGRYQAIKTAASTIDFSPSLSWMVADNLSIGAGVDIQYMKQQKTNAVDTASLANHMYQTSYPAGSMDTFVEVNEDSFAIGWNVGMLYQPVEGTRIGLSYRSRIAHSPEGDAKFDVPPALAGALTPSPTWTCPPWRPSASTSASTATGLCCSVSNTPCGTRSTWSPPTSTPTSPTMSPGSSGRTPGARPSVSSGTTAKPSPSASVAPSTRPPARTPTTARPACPT